VMLVLVAEAGLRWREEVVLNKGNCSQIHPQELVSFHPNCDTKDIAPSGSYIFKTNEDGFRDRPRSFFEGGTILVLGDSHVEGFLLPIEATLVRRLEERIGFRLLNLGIRGTGPSTEALRAKRAMLQYRAKAVGFLTLQTLRTRFFTTR